MKFTESADGKKRATIRITVRVTKEEVAEIKKYLRDRGERYSDAAVKRFVDSCTETDYGTAFYEDPLDSNV